MRCKSGAYVIGLTLVELLVAMAVMVVLLAATTPLLSEWKDDKALRGAAAVVMADLRWAISESVKGTAGNVTLRFHAPGDGAVWCYALTVQGAACHCEDGLGCDPECVVFRRSSDDHEGIKLVPGVVQNEFAFNPNRRTITAGNVQLESASGRKTKLVVSGYGRIRGCSPAGAAHVSGFANC